MVSIYNRKEVSVLKEIPFRQDILSLGGIYPRILMLVSNSGDDIEDGIKDDVEDNIDDSIKNGIDGITMEVL